jgi:hypothetical protein
MMLQLISHEISQLNFILLSVGSHSTFHIILKEVRTSIARRYLAPHCRFYTIERALMEPTRVVWSPVSYSLFVHII